MNNKFIELIPFKHGETKQPILINSDNIQTVIRKDDFLSKVFISNSIKYQLEEFITVNNFMYVAHPKYEDIVSILTNTKMTEGV